MLANPRTPSHASPHVCRPVVRSDHIPPSNSLLSLTIRHNNICLHLHIEDAVYFISLGDEGRGEGREGGRITRSWGGGRKEGREGEDKRVKGRKGRKEGRGRGWIKEGRRRKDWEKSKVREGGRKEGGGERRGEGDAQLQPLCVWRECHPGGVFVQCHGNLRIGALVYTYLPVTAWTHSQSHGWAFACKLEIRFAHEFTRP